VDTIIVMVPHKHTWHLHPHDFHQETGVDFYATFLCDCGVKKTVRLREELK